MYHRKRKKGIVLVFSAVLLFAFSAIVIRYGSLISHEAKVTGIQVGETQALYLAEAGINYALWELIHGVSPTQIQGQTRYLSAGKFFTITSLIDTYAFQGVTFTATASSYSTGHEPNLAVDKNLDTYWESNVVPGNEWIRIKFSSSSPTFSGISFDRVSFWAIPGQRPVDYKWQVERTLHPKTGEVLNWDTVFTKVGNTEANVTDIFDNVVNNKFYLRLLVSEAGDGITKTKVAVKEIEIPPCVHIESQGNVQQPGGNYLTKTVAQDFWVDTRTNPFTITRVTGTWQEK